MYILRVSRAARKRVRRQYNQFAASFGIRCKVDDGAVACKEGGLVLIKERVEKVKDAGDDYVQGRSSSLYVINHDLVPRLPYQKWPALIDG